VGIELTIAPDGTVSDARVTQPVAPLIDAAALTAARQWQFAPTFIDGRPVPVIQTVTVTITAPERVAPPRASPVKPPPPPPTTSAPPPAPPARSPVDNAAAIHEVLRRYQSAWQSLDAEALRRVQALSDSEARRIQQTMASADSYQVEMEIEDLDVAADGRRASARARVTRRFNPRVGQSEAQTVTNTFELEKRGDAWIITRIR
jgi:TonB family protein